MNADPAPAATTRFSDRVADYVRWRPDYPAAVLETLRTRTGLGPGNVVADVGAGTGIFTRQLLATGATVHAVEPNAPMRAALESLLEGAGRLSVHSGTAEATGLPAAGVDLVTAAQAFHWFDAAAARREFARILRPSGWIALLWNGRLERATPFLEAYEELLLEWSPDYARINHRNLDAAALALFFAPSPVERFTFAHRQDFDFVGLRGRLLSSSYAPAAGHPHHEPMLAGLRAIFEAHAEAGRVAFLYETTLDLARRPE